jgi:branched-chain amino acid aminotransferase
MTAAGMAVPEKFTTQQEIFKDEISKMLVKNKVFKGANVKITVFRTESDVFVPESDMIEYAVTFDILPQTGFDFNTEGLWITVYDKFRKYPSPLWNYNTHENTFLKISALKSVPAGEKSDDVVLLNQNGDWACSVIYGSVFILKDKTVFTPPLNGGAPDDVFREKVIQILKSSGYTVETEKPVSQEFAAKADQIFSGSTATGIRWVGAYKRRRFFRTLGMDIAQKINALYQEAE